MPGEFRTYRRGAGAPRPRSGRKVALGLPGRFAEEAEKGMPDRLGRAGWLLSPGVRSGTWTGVLDDEPRAHERRSLIANGADDQPRYASRHPDFTQELPRKWPPTRSKGAQSHSPEKR